MKNSNLKIHNLTSNYDLELFCLRDLFKLILKTFEYTIYRVNQFALLSFIECSDYVIITSAHNLLEKLMWIALVTLKSRSIDKFKVQIQHLHLNMRTCVCAGKLNKIN